MQKISIFYSWQSERPDSSEYIRATLDDCVKELAGRLTINIIVKDADADNRGSYDINNAVINAISDCDITVADLTPTSHGSDGRANPNSNALFEYASARSIKEHEKVLAVADISSDNINNFPFDFNHNALVTFKGSQDNSFRQSLYDSLEKIIRALLYPVLYEATTVFVSQRMAEGFPGVRDLMVYEDKTQINLHLDAFFKHPLVFGEAIDREGDREPVWWFRAGDSEAIKSYERKPDGVVLLDWNELNIRKIAVYSDSSRYYSEYLYIEADAMPPVFQKKLSEEQIQLAVQGRGYCDEEYAVIRKGGFLHKITRQEYDDGYAEVEGQIVPLNHKAELRCRYLTPFNFLVAAKFGAYNCSEFDRTSGEYFDGLLKGTVTLQQFHDYLMTFPKPQYR